MPNTATPHPDPGPGLDTEHPAPMTYRPGAYVVDTRTATLAQVMGTLGPHVQVRPPRGGKEWDVPPTALRLAGREERVAAGVRDGASASPVGCGRCVALRVAYEEARGGDEDEAVDAAIAVRQHFRSAHLLSEANTW
ncbi:hypothetical protein [Streptomyces sp. ISL-11]|uniref:hypothetical protein n=1 Tax=Streptomyces sp. ISL-11 TaxID=2819174 RepID=UPI001BEC33E2|nr:hypothetical protein [Streptomyces sp. ISL-11]MBT2385463.1 hypothetical protein [Streptomyces sp. ISL-11]